MSTTASSGSSRPKFRPAVQATRSVSSPERPRRRYRARAAKRRPDDVVRSLGGSSLPGMALRDVPDECLVSFQGRARLRREGGVLAGLGDAGELVEALADAGEFTQQGPRGRVGPGPRPGAERGLADEAGRGEACAPGRVGDLPELLGVEANQLGGGPAVAHGLLRGMEVVRRTVPINEYCALGRPVLGRGNTAPLLRAVLRHSA